MSSNFYSRFGRTCVTKPVKVKTCHFISQHVRGTPVHRFLIVSEAKVVGSGRHYKTQRSPKQWLADKGWATLSKHGVQLPVRDRGSRCIVMSSASEPALEASSKIRYHGTCAVQMWEGITPQTKRSFPPKIGRAFIQGLSAYDVCIINQ